MKMVHCKMEGLTLIGVKSDGIKEATAALQVILERDTLMKQVVYRS